MKKNYLTFRNGSPLPIGTPVTLENEKVGKVVSCHKDGDMYVAKIKVQNSFDKILDKIGI